jgi:hypothetical protein
VSHQPHRLRLELPGGGVVLEPVCALCEDVTSASVTCPICDRMFCLEPCFEVHLHARDAFESRDAIERFLASPDGQPFRSLVEEHVITHGAKPVDWAHARDCDDCRSFVHEVLMHVLVEALQDAELQECERE